MCRLKSGIILKGRVFVPEYDSHTKMLEELGITDDYLNASKTFVRAELLPVDGDVFSSIDNWILKVDQDVIPDWYDEETYKPQVIAAVKEWAKDHIHNGVDGLKISSGQGLYIKDCKDVGIYGNATVENICGSATVKYICDSATVKNICDSATVENIYGSATVENICDSATVKKAKGLSVIIGSKYGWNKKETLILAENATFKDCQTKTIYQSGDWKLVGVDEKERKA
nr:MAG TPA: hypothetical protein [Caudoviricetes sp.]